MTPAAAQMFSARVAGPVTPQHPPPAAVQRFSPAVMSQFLVRFQPSVPAPSMPVGNSQSGNLFEDRESVLLRWYLPEYLLADPPDSFFSFAATQTGELDTNGDPYNKGTLKLSLKKVMPPDVVAFQATHPTLRMLEIPLHFSAVTLATSALDPSTGQTKQTKYQGTVASAADGGLQLIFDNIVGPGVVILYQNLFAGGAQVQLAGSGDVVFRQTPPASATGPATIHVVPHSVVRPPFFILTQRTVPTAAPGPITTAPTYTPGTVQYSASMPLGTRFAANAYQLKFTIATASGSRPILGAADLKNFSVPQTEFTELKSLGDIGVRYPSLSRLYAGVLSKTIVAIPVRYTIVRGKSGCFSECLALLDSSPSAASKCKFEFTFDVGPAASPVEILQLTEEIAGHPELKDYQIKFPDFLSAQPPAVLASLFQSSFQFSGSGEPHIFTLQVEVRDDGANSPAVNNANLLMAQLSASKQPYLTGSIGLKLDDGYPSPVQSNVVLNFAETSGTDDLSFSIDQTAKTIQLANHSPLDLTISRYALGMEQGVTVVPFNQKLAANQTATLPLPENPSGLVFAAEAELTVPSPMTKADLPRYLTIGVQDVADTQFSISVNAGGVNFAGRGIDQIKVQISFASVPQLTPPSFSLNKLLTVAGAVVLVPIEHAITELDGTALFTVHFSNALTPDHQFTLQNDFCSQSILVLNDSDLPAA